MSRDENPDGIADLVDMAMGSMRAIADRSHAAEGWVPCVPIPLLFIYDIEDLQGADCVRSTALAALEQALALVRVDDVKVLDAMARLGVDASTHRAQVWQAHLRRCASGEITEGDTDDYWTVIRASERQGNLIESAKSNLARIDRLEAAADKLGWPAAWQVNLAGIWKEMEGTGESADSWAAAGWTSFEVLTREDFSSPWNAPIKERVRATIVPCARSANARRSPGGATQPGPCTTCSLVDRLSPSTQNS